LGFLRELVEQFLAGMKYPLREVAETAPSLLERLVNSLAFQIVKQWLEPFLERVTNPELMLAFIFAIFLAAFLLGVCVVVNLVIGRRRARVFISFQHERDCIAGALACELKRSGIAPVRLPFEEDPEHGKLLDQVKQAIRDCDVFVCLPGRRPSFVESEVMMAFGLEKPIVFVLIESDTPRLPNTAKKCYPMFALERLQLGGSRILANFCSYLAADWRSTVRLYGAIFAFSLWPLALGFLLTYLVSILVMLGVMGASVLPKAIDAHGSPLFWANTAVQDPPTFFFVVVFLVIFFVPYSVFMMTRLRIRSRIRRAISAEKFSESLFSENFLSQALDYSLAGEDLLNVLYRGDTPAEHESEASKGN